MMLVVAIIYMLIYIIFKDKKYVCLFFTWKNNKNAVGLGNADTRAK